jgi:hypothetical protein
MALVKAASKKNWNEVRALLERVSGYTEINERDHVRISSLPYFLSLSPSLPSLILFLFRMVSLLLWLLVAMVKPPSPLFSWTRGRILISKIKYPIPLSLF